jgi:glycosyltransferase involved in cell wall biosynthesis
VRTTLVVPTYQRRDEVQRLVRAIDAQASDSLDVVVVVDGSTDGTAGALQAMATSVPLRVLTQPNRGLSAARNAGLAAVDHDGAVWFLDDDMVPGDGLVERHVHAHDGGERRVVMGACRLPADAEILRDSRDWYDHVHATLSATGVVDRAELFSAANTSAPVALWREVGAFFEGFVGWGAEDHELALRLLRAGVSVRYDADAVAWHLQRRSIRELCRTKEQQGANAVRLARLHPDQTDDLFPGGTPGDIRVLRPLRGRPRAVRAAARAAAHAATLEHRAFGGRRHRVLDFAMAASKLAGVVDVDDDGSFVSRVLDGRSATRLASP